MARLSAVFNDNRALRDMAFARESSSTIIGLVSFPALFLCLSKMGVEGAPVGFVIPNMKIDGFMTDRENVLVT